MQKFKERLKTRRNRLGWTQGTLAQKSGVSERLIAGIESGEVERGATSITLSKVEDLAKALGVSALWLLGANEVDEKIPVMEDEPANMEAAVELLKRASALIDEATGKLRPRAKAESRGRPASSTVPSDARALAAKAEEKHDREHRKS